MWWRKVQSPESPCCYWANSRVSAVELNGIHWVSVVSSVISPPFPSIHATDFWVVRNCVGEVQNSDDKFSLTLLLHCASIKSWYKASRHVKQRPIIKALQRTASGSVWVFFWTVNFCPDLNLESSTHPPSHQPGLKGKGLGLTSPPFPIPLPCKNRFLKDFHEIWLGIWMF